MKEVLGSAQLARVIADHPMSAVDVGARGGIANDLLPIAGVVNVVGLEPDVEECARLTEAVARDPGPYRSLRFIPAALAGCRGRRILRLTRHRGMSSLMEALPGVGERYSRPDYYLVDRTVEVETIPLDDAISEYKIGAPVHLKIDIEGMEKEVLEAAPSAMTSLLAVRTEAVFLRQMVGQPLFHDIDACLRGFGFVPMGFEELHHWRRLSRVKPPAQIAGPIPYSRGQLVHCDVLYLRNFEAMPEDSEEAISRLIQMAFVALCYDYVDHAAAILARPAVASLLTETYQLDTERELGTASRRLLARYQRRRRRQAWLGFRGAVARRLGAQRTH